MSSKPRAYLFVGGGTGGHLYPALAIKQRLEQIDPDAITHFVCSDRAIDTEILSAASVEFTPVGARPVARSRAGISAFAKGWRSSSLVMKERIVELLPTRDVVVVAMGGFVAPPCAWAARRLRIPIVLVNLDAVPGKANLLVARFADAVCTALPVRSKQWTVIGPIVRTQTSSTNEDFGLDPDKPTLLVSGGSQGAESINAFVRAMVGHHSGALSGWQIIHQTGKGATDDLAAVYERAGISSWVGEYIQDMGSAWALADLTIGRCGAGTVAEAWSAGVPAVLLPYPYHKDQHQKHNAMLLVDAGAAVVLDDRIDPETNIREHGSKLAAILSDQQKLDAMRAGMSTLGSADGARAAAELLHQLRV